MKHLCFKLKTISPFSFQYLYFDTEDHLADKVFIKNKVFVKFGKEYAKNGEKYRIIFCEISKKNVDKFLKSIDELKDKMLLLGFTDYEEWCIKQLETFGFTQE